jgi:hypothetical protein
MMAAALKDSSAVKTGFLASLEECELMIEGISRDKISDLATNVIRAHLVAYTQDQCKLHGVSVQSVAIAPWFNPDTFAWESGYVDLPVWKGQPIVLVPKAVARYGIAYDHQKYYQHYVLNYLQTEALNAASSLVRTLKNKKKVVYKKDVAKTYPCTKDSLYRFSKDHPDVLTKYRADLARLELSGRVAVVEGRLGGPRFFDTDLGLLKDFAIVERVKLQFRAEFFNAFNNVNFGLPQNYLGSSSAGQITSAGSPRVLQFALALGQRLPSRKSRRCGRTVSHEITEGPFPTQPRICGIQIHTTRPARSVGRHLWPRARRYSGSGQPPGHMAALELMSHRHFTMKRSAIPLHTSLSNVKSQLY